MHGWGCDSAIWNIQLAYFGTQYSCIAIDLCGFGDSSIPDRPYSVRDYADRILELLDHLSITSVVVIGHSFGGRIAMELSILRPSMVRGLVLTASAGLRRFSVIRHCKVLIYKLRKLLCRIGLFNGKRLTRYGSSDYKASCGIMTAILVKATKYSSSRTARQIDCPTLLIWGNADDQTPLWIAHKLNRLIANSCVVMCGEGHFPFLSRPALYNAILGNYISALSGGEVAT
ncbi:MAG: alpha/beta hydrolase [Clostridia bacterium]|nr:alpha/beta hydrolase [Clostridia bacterium]